MIVGTAGHIDHGKTALVKALTGVDADRLKEEKARGMSIDLGFAYWPLAEGRSIGFIDVPGHERFVHTMLAGATGIDLAVLVIAADDGIMPQTREHLAILDLLGLSRAIVVLSKADLADAPRRAAVTSEIRAALAATAFAEAPIIPVSTITGEGLDPLREALKAAEAKTVGAHAGGRFRLAIDRSFTLAGAGTIVTGTVLSGTIRTGDQIIVSPSGLKARVRSIHAQNRPAKQGRAGQRCALNLAGDGVGKQAIARGDIALDPTLHAPTSRIDAQLHLLTGERKPVGAWFPARLHHGSTEAGVRVVPLEGAVVPGATGLVQLVLDRPIAATVGDAYVLRDVSAQRTLGGGRFLDLRAPPRRRGTPERLAALSALGEPDPGVALRRLLDTAPFVVDWTAFARDHALAADQADRLEEAAQAVRLDVGAARMLMLRSRWDTFTDGLVAALAAFHAEHEDLQGFGRDQLRMVVEPRLPRPAFLAALAHLVAAGRIVVEGGFVRLPHHIARLSDSDEALWDRIVPALSGEAAFRPPRVRDLARDAGVEEPAMRRLLKTCARLGRVDEIAHDHFFLRPTTATMVAFAARIASASEDGWFTAAAFRDTMDNGRKVAIQILDFFDRHGITIRRGDRRRIDQHRLDLFGEPPGQSSGQGVSPEADAP